MYLFGGYAEIPKTSVPLAVVVSMLAPWQTHSGLASACSAAQYT